MSERMLLSWRSVQGQYEWSKMLLSKGHEAVYPGRELLLYTWSCLYVFNHIFLEVCSCTWLLWLAEGSSEMGGWEVQICENWLVWIGSKRVNAPCLTNVRETHRIPVSPDRMSQFREASSDGQQFFYVLLLHFFTSHIFFVSVFAIPFRTLQPWNYPYCYCRWRHY